MRLSTFALQNLLRRPARVVVLVVAILLVATGFAFLTSQVQTTQILVRGTLNKNFRPAYDLLVEPKGSETNFEHQTGLVDENYLSGLFGGISEKQLAQIKSVHGVSLAAPIAMIGYTLLTVALHIPLSPVMNSGSDQVFRVSKQWTADNGLSRYPGGITRFYYWTTEPLVASPNARGTLFPSQVVPGSNTPAPICSGFNTGAPKSQKNMLFCGSSRQPDWASVSTDPVADTMSGGALPVATVQVQVPVLLAAIDPSAESRLVGLDKAMVSGRYLRGGEGDLAPLADPLWGASRETTIPVIATDRTYLDQEIEVSLARLATPEGSSLVSSMSEPSAYKLVTTAKPAASKAVTVPASSAYRAVLRGTPEIGKGLIVVPYYFTTSQVNYRVLAHDRLTPTRVRLGRSSWTAPGNGLSTGGVFTGEYLAPPGAGDTAYRDVTMYAAIDRNARGVASMPMVKIVGTFSPTKLAKFSALSHVPLGTFFPPLAYGASKKSKKLLHTKPLGPTTDVAGLLAQPPLLITTLTAAKPFFSTDEYSTTPFYRPGFRKPISAIQVRVSGLTGASDKSFARLRQVAVAIEQKTGLTVEITAGSSPKNVTIDLPKGKFGRPALELAQGWVKTNTAAVLLKGIDKESLSLWALLLLVCALFIGNAVVADLRGRRKELATLVTMGWTRGELTRLALFEVGAVGLFAGLSGTVLAIVLVEGFGLHLALADTLLVTPGGLVLSLLAGSGPVLRATRSLRPLELVRSPPAETAVRYSVRGITALALFGAWRRRGRSVLGVLAIAVGVGAATYLVGVEAAFHGEVVGTLLGNAVDLQVRGADLVALALIGVVAAGVVADLAYLSLKEREPQLASLRATGWALRDVARLVATEALVVAVLGGVVGAGAGYGVLAALNAPARTAVPTAVGAMVAGVVLALCSSLAPVTWWRRTPLAARLVEL